MKNEDNPHLIRADAGEQAWRRKVTETAANRLRDSQALVELYKEVYKHKITFDQALATVNAVNRDLLIEADKT